MPVLTRSDAQKLVESELRTYSDSDDWIIDESVTIERPFGWVFFSRAFLEDGNALAALAGNAPYIVNRHTGEIAPSGTALPTEDYVASYEATLKDSAI